MMLLVLTVSNASRLMRWTGVCAGILIATYITIEAPLSGTLRLLGRDVLGLAPAMLAHTARSLWIYFTAPPLGMLLAAELYVRRCGRRRVRCAKLHHPSNARCIFKCRFMESPA